MKLIINLGHIGNWHVAQVVDEENIVLAESFDYTARLALIKLIEKIDLEAE